MPIVRMKKPHEKEKLRIGFIHPDLGIGGAERLVVDAAVSLQRQGHDVVMFTSRHDPKRCFEETRDGTLQVHVLGSSLPRTLHPRLPLTIVFSILRSLLLTILLCFSLLLPGPATAMNPLSPIAPFDVFIVDQQSVSIPLLRLVSGTRVVFYCHFPDKLLSGGWEIDDDVNGQMRRGKGARGPSLMKRIYRWPIDKMEEFTTGQSDVVLSNSHFTSRIYARAFPSLAKRPPRVVYPCIDVDAYKSTVGASKKGKEKEDPGITDIASGRPTILSFNRFEAKKNVALAIHAFKRLRDDDLIPKEEFEKLRLVIGGGYDRDEIDNVETLRKLQEECDRAELKQHTIGLDSAAETKSRPTPPPDVQVLFILNFSNAQRTLLLTSPSTKCLLYTPANEHFGIVPIEAMACGVPVLAADSGGPVETIVDLDLDLTSIESSMNTPHRNPDGTGLLRSPTGDTTQWPLALASLIVLPESDRKTIREAARKRVEDKFSLATLGKDLDGACRDALKMGSLHDQIGDILIWGGAILVAISAVGLTTLVWMSSVDYKG